MKIKALVPMQVQPVYVAARRQCEHQVNSNELYAHREWRERHYTKKGRNPLNCQKSAMVELNGKGYCRAHGGLLALDYLLKNKGKP